MKQRLLTYGQAIRKTAKDQMKAVKSIRFIQYHEMKVIMGKQPSDRNRLSKAVEVQTISKIAKDKMKSITHL